MCSATRKQASNHLILTTILNNPLILSHYRSMIAKTAQGPPNMVIQIIKQLLIGYLSTRLHKILVKRPSSTTENQSETQDKSRQKALIKRSNLQEWAKGIDNDNKHPFSKTEPRSKGFVTRNSCIRITAVGKIIRLTVMNGRIKPTDQEETE